MVSRMIRVVAVVLVGVAVSSWNAYAVDYTWNVTAGGTQQWTVPSNWLPNNVAPSPSCSVTLLSTSRVPTR